jgi:hypothetical protein
MRNAFSTIDKILKLVYSIKGGERMADNYMEKIKSVNNLLVSTNVIKNYVEKLSQMNIEKYLLDIGAILYKDGKNIDNYTLFPYHTYIKKGTSNEVYFKIAITFGVEENSLNYKSQYPKVSVEIKKGVILIGRGKYLYETKDIKLDENDINFMIWNTNIDLQTLKDEVQWQPYSKPYINNIPNIENKIYKDYNIYLETHHVDNHQENKSYGNMVKVTLEQHASIHLWMWKDYILDDNFLKNNSNKNM